VITIRARIAGKQEAGRPDGQQLSRPIGHAHWNSMNEASGTTERFFLVPRNRLEAARAAPWPKSGHECREYVVILD
jgi:hypothetical protein